MKLYLVLFALLFSILVGNGQPVNRYQIGSVGIDEGLSQGLVHCIYQDSFGFIWMGTKDGLNRYDGYEFKVFQYMPKTPHSLPGNEILSITEDANHNLWLLTKNKGLVIFDRQGRRFLQPKINPKITPNKMHSDESGNIYLETHKKLYQANKKNSMAVDIIYDSKHDVAYAVGENKIWVVSSDSIVARIGTSNTTAIRMSIQDKGISHVSDIVANDSLLYGATDKGLLRVNIRQKTAEIVNVDINNAYELTFDHQGKLWYIKNQNLYVYNFEKRKNDLLTHKEFSNRKGRVNLLSLKVDEGGMLWMGTAGDGVKKIQTEESPFWYFGDGTIVRSHDNKLSIRRAYVDNNDNYWIIPATQPHALLRIDKASGKLTTFNAFFSAHFKQLEDVKDIVQDKNGDYWIVGSNIYHVDPKMKTLKTYDLAGSVSRILKTQDGLWFYGTSTIIRKTHEDFIDHSVKLEGEINVMYEGEKGSIWLGTSSGLFVWNEQESVFKKLPYQLGDIISICAGPKGADELWVGTNGQGLSIINLKQQKITTLTTTDGLPNNVIYGILADSTNQMWVSSNKGLTRITADFKMSSFDQFSGIQGNEFNRSAYFSKTADTLFFGGLDGLTVVLPNLLTPNKSTPNTIITKLIVHGAGSSYPIENSFLTNSLEVPHTDNTISIKFAALDYTNSTLNQFAYRIEDKHDDWIYLGNTHEITLSGLVPGNYNIFIKGSNDSGVWSDKFAQLEIVVTPPWWHSWWAYILYAIIIGAIVYTIILSWLKRVKLSNQLNIELKAHDHLKEMEHLRTRFFTYITHEFKNPLTMIIGQSKQLWKLTQHHSALGLQKNTEGLLKLVNQLLDLLKVESVQMRVERKFGNIVTFVEEEIARNSEHAACKGVKIRLKTKESAIFTFFDAEALSKCIDNLLTNAIKFSPEGSCIEISIKELEANLLIEVIDQGPGISLKDQKHIFEEFFKTENSAGGSGIGLALTKELIELQGGSITVDSDGHSGSIFTIALPRFSTESHFETSETLEDTTTSGNGLWKVLLIEDHKTLALYIKDQLLAIDKLAVKTTSCGGNALKLAKDYIPKLILCDINLPEVDGITLLKQFKADNELSHIPVVIITGNKTHKLKMKAISAGADGFIAKPFYAEELVVTVMKLIHQREKLSKKYKLEPQFDPEAPESISYDQKLLQQVKSIVERHFSDENFNVERLCQEVGISRVQLNRKMQVLTNLTPNQFIRNYRLEYSYQLLKNKTGSVAEIAFKSGFRSAAYFTKCFNAYYNHLPREVMECPE